LQHFAALNAEHWGTFQAKTKKQQLRDMTAPDTADAVREVRCVIFSEQFPSDSKCAFVFDFQERKKGAKNVKGGSKMQRQAMASTQTMIHCDIVRID